MEQIVHPRPQFQDHIVSQDLVSLYPFPHDITIDHKSNAATFAHEIYKQGAIPRCLVLWVDGSAASPAHDKLCSAAIGYHDPQSSEWREYVTISLLNSGSSNEAELMAIQEGLRQACTLTDYFDRLLLFSDCQSMLQAIKNQSMFIFLREKHIVNDIFEHANAIYNLGIQTKLHWVPADAHIEGHERVDEVSREYRRLATGLWPKDLLKCDAALEPITIIPGSLASAREDLRVILRDHLGQVKEAKSSNKYSRQLHEVIEQRRKKRLKRRIRKAKQDNEIREELVRALTRN